MLSTYRSADTIDSAEHNRASDVTTRHVVGLSARVNYVIDSLKRKVKSHKLDNRSESHHTRTNADTSETCLSNRCVNHSLLSKLFINIA